MSLRGLFRHRARAPEGPSLEEQVALLARAGLPLAPGVTRADLLDFGPEESYRAEPWRLLLMTYAVRSEPEAAPRPFCDRAVLVDLSHAPGQGDHATLAAQLAGIAGLGPRLRGAVEAETPGGRVLSYRLDGVPRQHRAEGRGPWLDDALIDAIAADLAPLMVPRALHALDNDLQRMFYALTPAGAALIEAEAPGLLTPLPDR
ncbi:hypothetical protein [Pseudoponticoccus marisrubri]|uniref:Uncharacterized protein n=1 Tax=Pseudoponticoccus marisrubri TaxID=1685382 RepID=A0A0W7WQI9_9RHOB|nr:hypothetical protein [Pseudoponticoccus marisrubri]KUF12772.1 hypothetical protein AVJ23_03415 [Pseudoponticoccus marisrubri]